MKIITAIVLGTCAVAATAQQHQPKNLRSSGEDALEQHQEQGARELGWWNSWHNNHVELSCEPNEEIECGLWGNKTGLLACREFGGWFGGEKHNQTLCIPADLAKEDDDCGPCEGEIYQQCGCKCLDDNIDSGKGDGVGVWLNYTRTGKLRCVSEADSVTALILGVYECAQEECPPESL